LIAGLLLVQFAVLRKPRVLFASAVVLLAIAGCFPDAAMLIAPPAIFGALLVALSWLIRHLFQQKQTARTVAPTTSSSVLDPSSKRARVRPLEMAAASTMSVPGELEFPAADSRTD
jgi:hypothetical protein